MDFEMRYNLTLLIYHIINSLLFITSTARTAKTQTLNQGFADQNQFIQDRPAKQLKLWTGSDQKKIENLGPGRTRTNKFLTISDRIGPVGPQTWRSGNTCSQYLPLIVLTQHCWILRLIHIRGLTHFRSWIHLSAVFIRVDLTIIRKICSTVECQMVSKI